MRKKYSRQLSIQPHSKQSLLSATNQFTEENEGGLNLGELVVIVRRRIMLIIVGTSAIAAVAAIKALDSPPIYVSKLELLTEPVTAEDKVVSGVQDDEDKESQDSSDNKLDETKLKVLQSAKLMYPIEQKVQMYYPGSSTLQLDVKLLPNTQILEVSYQDPNPEKVRFVLSTAAEAYLIYSLKERQTDTDLGIKFVEEQLPQLQRKVTVLQERLELFRQRYNMVNSEAQSQQLSEQLDQIAQKQQDYQARLVETTAFYNSLQSQLQLQPDIAEAVSALSESPRYQKLLNQLQDVETAIAAKSAQYRSDSPNVQALTTQKQNLLSLIEQEERRIVGAKLANTTGESLNLASPNSARLREIQKLLDAYKQVQVLQSQNQAINIAESSLRQRVKQFPGIVRQEDDLERQLKIANDNLNQFLSKREELRIEAAQKQVPWQILTPPTEPQNATPSVKRNLILGIGLGLLLSIGIALAIDKLNHVFYNSKEVKDQTKLPILGKIPFVKFNKNGKPLPKSNLANFWESFRSCYANIYFLSCNTSIRSLAIVSATAGDGKTTISLHLAQTAAAMGKQVLLVDANLRTPCVHTMLGLQNTQGLSNLLVEELDFQKVVKQFPSSLSPEDIAESEAAKTRLLFEQNLFVLTAGTTPPDPSILLGSPRMQSLTAQFHQAFDLVIYDTSHLLDFADSSLLTKYVDASILAVRIGKTNRADLTKAVEQLSFSFTPILGAIANATQS
ncbi:GumC family protein [Aliterella atlantica]|uniref:Capsular biosynthesis protein n=1 Tax=Aliterella atlantica CENA595 TaxID=1618023 RepID=A0A0D8ZXL5_9CYAN|nr:tyrosine-protein kinase domain-containing protein [Aliterella atlantica]KJH73142.1 capsular biosynthesis protein [Aliterella atlantica CENA595]